MKPSSALIRSDFDRREFLRRTAAFAATAQLLAVRPLAAETPAELRDGKKLIVHSAKPMNGEPELGELVKNWITPVDRFYIRTHGNTPRLDAGAFRLTIEGLVEKPATLTLPQLAALPQATTTATLTCAGNRRKELSAIKPIAGVPWDAGAIGNARWDGVRLSDLLKHVGLKEGAKHVWFESVDVVKLVFDRTTAFGASIPLERALADRDGAPGGLLATRMNEKPLPVDHGFPLRGVVPGYIGARSVKWLTKIVVSDRPSPNHFLAENYKLVKTTDLEEMKSAEPLYEFAINSVICSPAAGSTQNAGGVEVAGYALAYGRKSATIEKVQVSVDGGKSWKDAKLTSPRRDFCWQLWSARLELPAGPQRLTVRAIDSAGAVQPETTAWNAKGYMYNGWHSAGIAVR